MHVSRHCEPPGRREAPPGWLAMTVEVATAPSTSSRASEARPGIHNRRASLLRRSSAVSGLSIDSAVRALAFARMTASPLRRAPLHRSRDDHLRQQTLALGLGAVALHRRGEAFEDAVLEGGDNGVMDVALAADRGRVGEFVGRGADGFQDLLLAAAGAF